jgi:hypothetical protein
VLERIVFLLGVTVLTLSTACDAAPASSSAAAEDDRGPLGKADNMGSCLDLCGGPSMGTCWCDTACVDFGDCCADYEVQCESGATTGETCEALGGQCTLPSPDGCGSDAISVDAACELANDFCCVPQTGGSDSGTPMTCEDLGGQCKIPSPEGCGSDAESVDAPCELLNDFCCVPT